MRSPARGRPVEKRAARARGMSNNDCCDIKHTLGTLHPDTRRKPRCETCTPGGRANPSTLVVGERRPNGPHSHACRSDHVLRLSSVAKHPPRVTSRWGLARIRTQNYQFVFIHIAIGLLERLALTLPTQAIEGRFGRLLGAAVGLDSVPLAVVPWGYSG